MNYIKNDLCKAASFINNNPVTRFVCEETATSLWNLAFKDERIAKIVGGVSLIGTGLALATSIDSTKDSTKKIAKWAMVGMGCAAVSMGLVATISGVMDFMKFETAPPRPESIYDSPNTLNVTKTKCIGVPYLYNNDKIPVISSLGGIEGGIPKLPKIDLIAVKDLKLRRDIVEDRGLYTFSAYKKIPELTNTSISSTETADLLVRALKDEPSFGWEYLHEGCNQRAALTHIVLKAMGLSQESVMIKKVRSEHLGFKWCDETHYWDHHTAAAIQLKDGTQLILDPSTDPDKAQTLSDWIVKSNFVASKECVKSNENCPVATVDFDYYCAIWKTLEINRKHTKNPIEDCVNFNWQKKWFKLNKNS